MIFPFLVQPSISCRYDGKGTFYNIFQPNVCKKQSPEFVSRRDADGSATQRILIANNAEAIVDLQSPPFFAKFPDNCC